MTSHTRRRLMDRKIIELLLTGVGVNKLARTLHVGKNRIRALRRKAEEAGYIIADGRRGEVALPPYPERVFPDPADKRSLKSSAADKFLEPHHAWMKDRLSVGWHAVTVFEELPASRLTRASFYRYLVRHKLNRLGEEYRGAVTEIIHKPGEALLVDWGKLCDVREGPGGRQKTLWQFTGILGYSRKLMVRLVWSNDVATTLKMLESMFREIGGVPLRITSDNPKCFTLKASKYEPILNPAYERFAAHYGVLIESLPPREPKKKGKVERPIPYVRRLYEAHEEIWEGIEEAQSYMDRKVGIANQRKHGTTLRRPGEVYELEEKASLRPLPALSYEIEQYQEGDVRADGHVRFANKYYSVDEQYRWKKVTVLADSRKVSIYFQGKLLEVHDRITDPNQSKSTKPCHMSPWERAMRDDSIYRRRAARLGANAEAMVMALLKQGQGFVDTRKIWGILSLDKQYPAERIDAACGRALKMGLLGYRAVLNILAAEEARRVMESHCGAVAEVKPAKDYKFLHSLTEYQEQLALFELANQQKGGRA